MTEHLIEKIQCPSCHKTGPVHSTIRQCYAYGNYGRIWVTDVGYRCEFCQYEHGFQTCPPAKKKD